MYLLWNSAGTLFSWRDRRGCGTHTTTSERGVGIKPRLPITTSHVSGKASDTFSSPAAPAAQCHSSTSTQDERVTSGDGPGRRASRVPWRRLRDLCTNTSVL